MLKQLWFRQAQPGLCIDSVVVEEGVRVELAVAIVIVTLSMITLPTPRRGELDLRNTQPFIRSGVLGGQSELGNTGDAGGVHAEEGVCAHQVVVDLDAVPGNIRERSAQTINDGPSNVSVGIDAGHAARDIYRVASVKRQVLHLLNVDRG